MLLAEMDKLLQPLRDKVAELERRAGIESATERARVRAQIPNLRFHDLRHTATSRMAHKLSNVIELASVTGHQTIQMLKRYYHPNAEELARKLG